MAEATTEQVVFYVRESSGTGALARTVCLAVHDLWNDFPAAPVFVQAADDALARELDDALWTFRDDSFIPHAVIGAHDQPDAETPVVIATRPPEDASRARFFVDSAASAPASTLATRFERVYVILDNDPERRAAGRDRFREWRALGLTPQTKKLGSG